MRTNRFRRLLSISLFLLLFNHATGFGAEPATAPSTQPANLIDFSCVGYGGNGSPPPNVSSVLLVHPSGGDDTRLLQSALDRAATLPANSDGWHGAVELAAGTYQVSGQLNLSASGVVLRGSGDHATTIFATGHDRRTLIEIGQQAAPSTSAGVAIIDEVVPAGGRVVTLASVRDFKVRDTVVLTRPSTAKWISDLGMKGFAGAFADLRIDWTPGSRDLVWDRAITSLDRTRNQITLDAPVTTALEKRYGGATVSRVTQGEPNHIGVENLILESAFDSVNNLDEQHSWIAVAVHGSVDSWVRGITARHFAGSAVRVGPRARRITVDSCKFEQPVSEPGGYRRQSFLVEGQQVLVKHCTAESGMNDFAVGHCAAGPNVFFDCAASHALGDSGSFESWASGILYENVRIEGAGIRLTYDMRRAQGGGWTAVNSIVSNCQAASFDVRGPDGAGNALVNSSPGLYVENRAQSKAVTFGGPAVDFVAPALPPSADTLPSPSPLQIINGRFAIGNRTLWGGAVNDAWWKGEAIPAVAPNYGVCITRFVPGRDGPGMIENLPDLAQRMEAQGTPFYQSGPGLWYDRRRDEHSVYQRSDANVWAPFNELPWARSGQSIAGQGVGDNITAWDGLSRYDLTRYNTWYFDRTRQFADLCDQHGLLLFHSMYNTHNVLEWGAHWIDYPWRPANNINQTSLPEPPPLVPTTQVSEPNIRIHVANQFYNVDDPSRRALHHDYIFHVLDQLGSSSNIVFGVAFQYPGPLEFEQFFLDTVAEWEKKSGRTVRVELATSKDITDAILVDPVRSKQISVIDMRYWQYRPDGSLWAPPGGRNLAFREAVTVGFGAATDFPPATTPQQLYRQVREYRDKYPDKAIIAWFGGIGPAPILMAGGAECLNRNPTAGHSQNTVDRTPVDLLVQRYLADELGSLTPRDGLTEDTDATWCMGNPSDQTLLIYSVKGEAITISQQLAGGYSAQWLNPRNGNAQQLEQPLTLNRGTTIPKPTSEEWFLLLHRVGN